MNIQTVLTGLCGQPGPSGFEGPAARYASELLRPLVDEVRVDCSGNVVGVRRCGCSGAKKLLLDAHLDEVGLIVTGIEDGSYRAAYFWRGVLPATPCAEGRGVGQGSIH